MTLKKGTARTLLMRKSDGVGVSLALIIVITREERTSNRTVLM
jgi:hypothetical protein